MFILIGFALFLEYVVSLQFSTVPSSNHSSNIHLCVVKTEIEVVYLRVENGWEDH